MEIYKNLSLENLPNEEWKDVVGYEGLYQVSNLGRVKMLMRKVLANKSIKTINEHLIKQIETSKGYLYVDLWMNNTSRRLGVHRLVLLAFTDKGINTPLEVNHINEIRKDNRLCNLEWLTHKENINYGLRTEKHKIAMRNHKSLSIPIIQYDLQGNIIKEFPSMREVVRQLHIGMDTIRDCCKGNIKNVKGFIFKYKE